MTTTDTPEYRKLELDSSNDIIRHDARRSDRKYAEAALHARDAGLARVRMGQIMFDGGDFAQAAADWLSAAACFHLATDPKRMREAFDRAEKLDQEGKTPPERRDIHEALKERGEQLKALEEKLTRFAQDYSRMAGLTHTASQEVLEFLLRQVRELPGLFYLHALIGRCAGRLGQKALADHHLDWAEKIVPGDTQLEALRVSLLLASPALERGLQKGRELLSAHPDMADLRMHLAIALTFEPKGQQEDWDEAFAILQPLLQTDSAEPGARLGAFGLVAISRYRAGDETEYRRYLETFEQLAAACLPPDKDFVTQLRRAFPHIFPQPGSNGAPLPTKPDYAAARALFKQFGPLAVSA